jgi:hypothetical protein
MAGQDDWWSDQPLATAADAKAYGGNGRAATSPQDRIALNAASMKAQTERDAMKDYDATERAVRTMDTGPLKASFLDAITPSENGGILDTVGSVAGLIARPFISQDTLDARDTLNTVAARSVTRGQTLPPGPASDRDVALARTAGVNPYKGTKENLRIIGAARRDSGLEQTRALLKSGWISKFGSLANASPNGMTFEEAQQIAENDYLKAPGSRSARPALPKAPPPSLRKKTSGDGWSIQKMR